MQAPSVGSEKDGGVKGDEVQEASTGPAPMLGGAPTVSEPAPRMLVQLRTLAV